MFKAKFMTLSCSFSELDSK